MAVTDTEAHSEDTDMGRGHQSESGVRLEWGGEGERTRSSGCCNPFGLSLRFLSASNCQGLHEDCVLSSSAKEAAVGCSTRVT